MVVKWECADSEEFCGEGDFEDLDDELWLEAELELEELEELEEEQKACVADCNGFDAGRGDEDLGECAARVCI